MGQVISFPYRENRQTIIEHVVAEIAKEFVDYLVQNKRDFSVLNEVVLVVEQVLNRKYPNNISMSDTKYVIELLRPKFCLAKNPKQEIAHT